MTSKVVYKENLRCESVHIASGTMFETDAPVDNHGKGLRFSPTDTVATGLASCALTVMGIVAERHAIDMKDTYAEVQKVMYDHPRRIGEIHVKIVFPKNNEYSDAEKQLLERTARTCPVFQSLHPDMIRDMTFEY